MSVTDVEDRIARSLAALAQPDLADLQVADIDAYLAELTNPLDPTAFTRLSEKITEYSGGFTSTFTDATIRPALLAAGARPSKSAATFGVRNPFFTRYVLIDPPAAVDGNTSRGSWVQVYAPSAS
jgi:hypothetical protein